MKTIVFAVCLAVLFAATGSAQASLIAGFDIPQTVSGYTAINPIGGGSPDVVATPLFRGSGLSGSSFGNHFYFTNWNTVVDLTKFYSTTLSVDAGNYLTLTDLTYSVEDAGHSAGAFSTFHVRTSLDGFVSDVDSFVLTNFNGLVVDRTTSLSSLGAITGAIEFRFYATTQSTGVRMGFANHLPGGTGGGASDVGQNIRFNGDVAAIPEPSTLLLGALAIVGLLTPHRRKKQPKAPSLRSLR